MLQPGWESELSSGSVWLRKCRGPGTCRSKGLALLPSTPWSLWIDSGRPPGWRRRISADDLSNPGAQKHKASYRYSCMVDLRGTISS